MMARPEAVAVSSHGLVTGYFFVPEEYEAFRRLQEQRRSFATVELAPEKVKAIGASRIDERHGRLDDFIDDAWRGAWPFIVIGGFG
jgi:hypothetical protein